MKVVQVRNCGSPESMQIAELALPDPGEGQVRVKIAFSGVNFIDVYFRAGLYKAELPVTIGMEAAGIVDAVGEGVSGLAPGDRVAYAMSRGSYAEFALVPAWQLVKVPENISFEAAAAIMLQGMTAHYLTRSTYPLKSGDIALVHAAAGGAGQLVVQLAKAAGATVIATVSTQAKAELATSFGADHVINYAESDFEVETKNLTGGRGVDVVYDSVGVSTFAKGLNVLRPRGMMVLYGQSSGPVPPFDPGILNQKGSLYLTRPSLGHYAATSEEVAWRSGELFGWISQGKLSPRIDRIYPLAQAAQAHRDLEGRKTTGKLLLQP